MGLLMRGQDVHERSGGVCRCRCGVDGAAAAQRRRQIEGGCWGSSVKSLLLEGLLRRRRQWRSKGWDLGGAPLPLAGSVPLPSSTSPGPGSQCIVQRTESLPAALSGLGIAQSWERLSNSLLPDWLLQGEETSLPREAVSELGFRSPAKRRFPGAHIRH